MLRTWVCILSLLFLNRCGSDGGTGLSMAEGFSVQPYTASKGPFAGVQGARVRLAHGMLKQPLLLSPVMVVASNTPLVDYLQPKIVTFERNASQLALFEINQQALYDSLPSRKLLQTFDIVESTAQGMVFDWQLGLRAVPMSSPLGAASDIPEAILTPMVTFLRRATLQGDALELEQVSTIALSSLTAEPYGISLEDGTLVDQNVSVTLVSRLTSYHLSSSYTPASLDAAPFPLAFDVTQPRRPSSAVQRLATRWDLKRGAPPIIYVIPQNTPAELIPVIREGVLYWNRVAGREIVAVQTHGDNLIAPAERRVVLHWTDWTDAAFSEASLQADPRTGEILHASVFLTSAFDSEGAVLGRRMEQHMHGGQRVGIQARGFASARTCRRRERSNPRLPVVRNASDTELVKRVAHDYLRGVVAHEVGHTLGLRHNFAANLDSVLPDAAARIDAWHAYLRGELASGTEVASSVMDYPDDEDAALEGAYLLRAPLPYDTWALRWLYNGGGQPTALRFCTDEDAEGPDMDCRPWDTGRDPLAGRIQRLADHRGMSEHVLATVLDLLAPPVPEDRIAVDRLAEPLEAEGLSAAWAQEARMAFKFLRDDSTLLRVDGVGWARRDALLTARRQSVNAVGGLPGMLRAAFPTDGQGLPQPGWLLAGIVPTYPARSPIHGRTLHGVDYRLERGQLKQLKSALPVMAERLEQQYLQHVLIGLTGGYVPDEQMSVDDLAQALRADHRLERGLVHPGWLDALTPWLEHVLLAQTAHYAPRFAVGTRLAALRLLNPVLLPWPEGAADSWLAALQPRVDRMARALGNAAEAAPETLRAMDEEKAVLVGLQAVADRNMDIVDELLATAILQAPWRF